MRGISFRVLINEILKIQTEIYKKDDDFNYKNYILLVMQLVTEEPVKKEKESKDAAKENKEIVKEIKENKEREINFIKKMHLIKKKIIEEALIGNLKVNVVYIIIDRSVRFLTNKK